MTTKEQRTFSSPEAAIQWLADELGNLIDQISKSRQVETVQQALILTAFGILKENGLIDAKRLAEVWRDTAEKMQSGAPDGADLTHITSIYVSLADGIESSLTQRWTPVVLDGGRDDETP